MALRALLLDVDGTLADTNEAHVAAWRRAFAGLDYRVGHDRIAEEIGKGGDLLISAVLGRDVERRHGEALRRARRRAFRARIERDGVTLFPGVAGLLDAVRARGLRTAIATSSLRKDLSLLEARLGRSFASMVDTVTTGDDAEASKPAPHVVEAACAGLGEDPLACALLGDSLHDAAAARAAGVAFLGVASGYVGEAELRAAGARFVARDLEHLTGSLGGAMFAASPGPVTFDLAVEEALMRHAIAAAHEGLRRGEVPIGAAIFTGDGAFGATGENRIRATGDVTAHAEIEALRRFADSGRELGSGAILVSTVEPCVMCLGAAMEVGIDVIIHGLEAPADGGRSRVDVPRSPESRLPRVRGGVCRDEARSLLVEWLARSPGSSQRPFVEQLVAETDSARRAA
jgi:phosphoglycolate phosphatase-like HAD superfamily hydrolase/tRNA(Arg) A34 adenosine deaminase TadA